MRRTLALFLLLLGCGKSNPVTAGGTVLVDWDASKSSRPEFAKAAIGPRTSKDFTITVSHKDTPAYTLTAHVDFADVDFIESGGPVHQRAPVAMKVTVKENTGWELTAGKCNDGPNYKMPGVGPDGGLVTPLGMSQECMIKEHRQAGIIFSGSWDIGFSVIGKGAENAIEAFPDSDVKIQ